MKRLRPKKSIKKTSIHHASEKFANIRELLEHYDKIWHSLMGNQMEASTTAVTDENSSEMMSANLGVVGLLRARRETFRGTHAWTPWRSGVLLRSGYFALDDTRNSEKKQKLVTFALMLMTVVPL